jgi:hypothetical protein
MSKFTINGLSHLIAMLQSYPQLMGLHSFTAVREVARTAQQAANRGGCNKCAINKIYNQNAHVFTRALEMLGNGEHTAVKAILKVDQICYNVRDSSGKLHMKCI